ncbi:MAG: molybdopterin-synthase adenylyltransferase MoeB, partial [Acidimicrobiia bacterium]|nr:molybdopterin-synthase adenylyltransferase MoeB [Acidimicrobiia bacterium]
AAGEVVVIDCREQEEFPSGVIPGASLVPRSSLEAAVSRSGLASDTPIVIYCSTGIRSALAGKTLQDMGYTNVTNLAGGIVRWKAEGRALQVEGGFSEEQRQRYARHLVLPEVGEAGQRKLLDSRVAVIGAGGLGSPVALYLAAAGVGTLGVIDFDLVDASNLQRQILHAVDRVGQPKVDSARQAIASINPDVVVEAHRTHLQASNVLDLLAGYDVIVDGADNFPTRYLLNDASLHLRTPVVHGSIFRFEGQVSVFNPYDGPCYRCLFPQPPPPELATNCAEAGVLGVLPGIIGSIQAMEAIKLILGLGDSLSGRLMVYDALDQEFQTVEVRRNPTCPACGDEDSPPVLVDYDDYCLPVAVS